MWAFIKLTRPLNLLIIALTMFLMRHGVIEGNLSRSLRQLLVHLGLSGQWPAQPPAGLQAQMPLPLFTMLVASTVLIAAAGNIINDYFDTRIDRINRPGEVIVGRSVKRRIAMVSHLVLSALGLLLAAYAAWRCGMLHYTAIPVFAIAGLWSYSITLKGLPVAGNVMIALLTALVPLTVGLYEIPLLERTFQEPQVVRLPNGVFYEMEPVFRELWGWILGYSIFAFLSTLVRELQKDMADVKGDLAAGCRTIPIAWGMKWARAITLFHILLIVIGVMTVRMLLPGDRITFWYLGIGVIGPLLLSAGFTYGASTRTEHVRAGQLMKLAMVMAVAFSLVIPHLP